MGGVDGAIFIPIISSISSTIYNIAKNAFIQIINK